MTPAQRRFEQAQRMAEQERMRDQLRQAMQTRNAMPSPMSQSRRALQSMQVPVQRADGGMVTNAPRIPTLMELAQPNFQMQQARVSEAPFTTENPVVPMSMQQSPAFGGMPRDVYGWTPSQVRPMGLTSTPRQPAAMTTDTSTYTPVDTSSIGGMNISGAADIAGGALPGILSAREAEQERLRQEQDYLAQVEEARRQQAEKLARRQQAFEEQQASAQEQFRQQLAGAQGQISSLEKSLQDRLAAQRESFESEFDKRLQQGIQAELDRRAAEEEEARKKRYPEPTLADLFSGQISAAMAGRDPSGAISRLNDPEAFWNYVGGRA